jgi:predicted DNA-binding transcriptional regulator YafY
MTNPFVTSVKFLSAVTLLSGQQGSTIKGLMENLNISRRSVFRLLQALEDLGFPLIDSQNQPKGEKTYQILDSFVVKLPNMAIPNPSLTDEEFELILYIFDSCKRINELGGIPRLNAIKNKIAALKSKGEKKQ